MSRRLVLCAIAVALLGFSTSTRAQAASAVYFVVEWPSGASETWIYATNHGNSRQEITTRYIPAFSDGTEIEAEKTYEIFPNRTRIIMDAVEPGRTGLLEVVAPGDVSVAARMTELGNGPRTVPQARVPAISSLNAAEGGTALNLAGFQRTDAGDVVSDVRLVNLSAEPVDCEAEVFRGNGENAWGTILLGGLTPLSVIPFDDFFVSLQEPSGENVRVRFTCDDSFYAYGVIREDSGEEISFVLPSASVATDGLPVPGEDNGGGGGSATKACLDADICIERKGTFHTGRPGDAHEPIELPIPPGQYRKLHLNVDVFNGGPPNLRNSSYVEQLVFWLAVTNHYNLYGFVRLRNAGPGYELSNTYGVGIPFAAKEKQTTGLNWPFGQTYNFDYVFDAENRSITLTVTNRSGNVVAKMQAPANVSRVTMPSASHEKFHLVFGYNEGRENRNEYTSYNWKYSNLAVGVYR